MSVLLESEQAEIGGLSLTPPAERRAVWRRFRRNPFAIGSAAFLAALVVFAIFYPMVSPYSYRFSSGQYRIGPCAHHWLGTNDGGYDILTLLAVGARVSLLVGVSVEAMVLLVGGAVGLCAGYFGRGADMLLMRITDIMFAFPDILLAILIMATQGRTLLNLLIALSIAAWPGMARLIRGQTMAIRRLEYIDAAIALGLPNARIIFRHALPNLLSTVVVAAAIDIAGVIIAEATLSFLGIGIQPPLPSWGSMISEPLQSQLYRSDPVALIAPAATLGLTVLALNFLGDALRDALDPRHS